MNSLLEIIDDIEQPKGINKSKGVSNKDIPSSPKVIQLSVSEKLAAEYTSNIKKAEDLKSKINLSMSKEEMLEAALQCISLLTGDNTFYKSNIEKIK